MARMEIRDGIVYIIEPEGEWAPEPEREPKREPEPLEKQLTRIENTVDLILLKQEGIL
jgi:hypothetical protein